MEEKYRQAFIDFHTDWIVSNHSECIFLKVLKECSKHIYALSYTLERILSMSRKGINSFFKMFNLIDIFQYRY